MKNLFILHNNNISQLPLITSKPQLFENESEEKVDNTKINNNLKKITIKTDQNIHISSTTDIHAKRNKSLDNYKFPHSNLKKDLFLFRFMNKPINTKFFFKNLVIKKCCSKEPSKLNIKKFNDEFINQELINQTKEKRSKFENKKPIFISHIIDKKNNNITNPNINHNSITEVNKNNHTKFQINPKIKFHFNTLTNSPTRSKKIVQKNNSGLFHNRNIHEKLAIGSFGKDNKIFPNLTIE